MNKLHLSGVESWMSLRWVVEGSGCCAKADDTRISAIFCCVCVVQLLFDECLWWAFNSGVVVERWLGGHIFWPCLGWGSGGGMHLWLRCLQFRWTSRLLSL